MCKNKELCDKIKEIRKVDVEAWLYDLLCDGCECELRCHWSCEHCEEFENDYYGIEENEECEHYEDFYHFSYGEELTKEEQEEIIQEHIREKEKRENERFK